MIKINWDQIINTVSNLPYHSDYFVLKQAVGDLPTYFKKRFGSYDGKIKGHYSVDLKTAGSIHVKVYDNHYLVHRDMYDPNTHPFLHMIFDAPKETLAGLFLADQVLLNGKITNWAIKRLTKILFG